MVCPSLHGTCPPTRPPRAPAPTGRVVFWAPWLVWAASPASPHTNKPKPHSIAPLKTSLPLKPHSLIQNWQKRNRANTCHGHTASPPPVRPCSLSATFAHICLTGERMGQRRGGPVSLGLACWWQQRFGRQGEPGKMVPYLGPSSGGCLVSTCWCRAEWSGLPHTIAVSGDSRGPHVGVSGPDSQRPGLDHAHRAGQ